MFVIVLGQHVSILIESSSGPSKIDPYLEMLKCAVGSQTLTFLIKLCIKCMCRVFNAYPANVENTVSS